MNERSMPPACVMAVLALSACGVGKLTSTATGFTGCDTITCSNSPDTILFGGYSGLHQLSLSGAPNSEKLWLSTSNGHAQIVKGSDSYNLYVRQGRLIGVSDTGVLQAADLMGADILVHYVPVNYKFGSKASSMLTLHINSVRWFAMPFGQDGSAEVYRITTNIFSPPTSLDGDLDPPDSPPDPIPPLCASDDDRDVAHNASFPDMEPGEVLAFEGDRIDVIRKTMNAEPDLDWFNFGCAGSAAAKLYLMGETVATQPHPLDDASWQERQAMLKMLVADYCGTGRAFTVHGEPLLWQGGRISYALSPSSLEARWNANGAICLGMPRLEVYPDPGVGASSDLTTAIASECGSHILPECLNTDPWNYDGAVVVSANRP